LLLWKQLLSLLQLILLPTSLLPQQQQQPVAVWTKTKLI
jgi:hypothetical protein